MLGITHFRCHGTDGVSLEIQKRTKVLDYLGIDYTLICGEEFHWLDIYKTPCYSAMRDKDKKFFKCRYSLEKLQGLWESIFKKYGIKGLYVHNLFSLPVIPEVSLALLNAIKDLHLSTVAIDHDFWQSRKYFRAVPQNILSNFPPFSRFIKHRIINSLDFRYFKGHRQPKRIHDYWLDIRNGKFVFSRRLKGPYSLTKRQLQRKRRKFGEIVFLQATRIVPRKGIENAIRLIAEFNKLSRKKTILFLSNPEDLDKKYYEKLLRLSQKLQVNMRLWHKDFWLAYEIADVILYPSLVEGFGNQFLEAIYFKKLVVVYEYPVFKKDIKPLGFKVVSLGGRGYKKSGLFFVYKDAMLRAAQQVFKALENPQLYNSWVSLNFKLLQKYFGPQEFLKDTQEDLRFFKMMYNR